MISKKIITKATDVIGKFSLARFEKVYTELQDGGTHLLISIDSSSISENEIEMIRRPLACELNIIVPEFEEQDLGSWTLVFIKHGEVFEAIHPHDCEL